MFNNLPRLSRIVETFVSGAKAISGEYQALFPAYHTLQQCYEKLQEAKALLDGLSEDRRRKIQIASQRRACLSLEDLEMELDRLILDYRGLCRFYDQSSSFQRYFPGNRLRADVATFKDQVQRFYSDTWKTTAPGDRSIHWNSLQMNMG